MMLKMLFIFMCAGFCIFLLCYVIYKTVYRKKTELSLQQTEMETKISTDILNAVEEMRSLRHDLNSHITVTQGLLAIGKYEEAVNYLASLKADVQKVSQYVFIQPLPLTILLNDKINQAQKNSISLECELFVSKIELKDKDLVTLIGNILDNAIEAAVKTPDKKIYFSISLQKSCYLIHCDNSFVDMPIQNNSQFLTTKKDKMLHGIGLKNIFFIAHKYKGNVQIQTEDRFAMDVSIPILNNLSEILH